MKTAIKKIIIFLFAAILCLGAVSCGDKNDFVPAGYKRASDESADHALYVPEGWIVDNTTGVTIARASKTDTSNISFMSFELDKSKLGDKTLEGETEKRSLLDRFWDYYDGELRKTLPNMTYDEKVNGENTVVSKLAAKKYIYTASVTDIEFKILQIVVIKGDTVYLLTYTAKTELFDEHYDTVIDIAGYIELK